MKNTNALDDSELDKVIGGVALHAFAQAAGKSGGVCGKYFARDGRESETPACDNCIHSVKGLSGRYSCGLTD